MQFVKSFSFLATRYDAFILDLWGVIHDGQKLYPGAKECLEQLRAAGKKIVLLSNAPRRAQVAAESLAKMDVTAHSYDTIITSGEALYQCLASNSFLEGEEWVGRSSGRYIYIGLERDRAVLQGLPYKETDDPAQAEFLLLSHSCYDNQPARELAPLLARCLAAGLSALCINPDKEVVRLTGERVYCAGVIAADYQAMGGRVMYFGKPHPFVYVMAMGALAGMDKTRILAVGDSLLTDIEGARRNNLACALVTGGILKERVGEPGMPEYEVQCRTVCAQHEIAPDYVVASFNPR